MVPDRLINYFLASSGAGAALVGLIFVAISLSPKETVMPGAAPERRAVAGSSFLALINAFFISLSALHTSQNLGWNVLILSIIGIVNSLWLGVPLFKRHRRQGNLIANALLVLISLLIYGTECFHAIHLLVLPNDASSVDSIAGTLTYVYAIGLLRAWELLGVEQIGLGRWLNPLRAFSSSTPQENTGKSNSESSD